MLMMNNREGSITVFLTLTGLLIFALMGTLVETARFGVCANHAARTLRTSAEGLLTEYSRPLQKQYGLFFMEQRGTPYETVISRYAADTMEASGGKMDMLQGVFNEISVQERYCAGDDGAAAVGKEITAYMKNGIARDALDKFQKKRDQVQKGETVAADIDETAQKQEELAGLDDLLLDLIKLVDGIVVNNGNIRCENDFMKCFSRREDPQGKDYGIQEAVVWKKIKDKLDTTPASWNTMSVPVFRERIRRVIRVTRQAVEKGEMLKRRYQKIRDGSSKSHDAMIENVVKKLPVIQSNLRVFEETEKILDNQEKKPQKIAKLEDLWRDYDPAGIVFDYTGVSESGGASNPFDALAGSWQDGIFSLVLGEEEKKNLSDRNMEDADHYAKMYSSEIDAKDQKKTEDYGDRMKTFTTDQGSHFSEVLKDTGVTAADTFCLLEYTVKKFSNYCEKQKDEVGEWKHSLSYEWEYLATGKKSDKKNLEAVLNRILLLRIPVNFAAIGMDQGKKTEAYAAAAAVVGFTGMEPLIRLTQTIILITWAVVESLVDVAALLQGKKIAVVKRSQDICTTFAEVFRIHGSAITARASRVPDQKNNALAAGYSDYLKIFLAVTGDRTCRYRLMDIMQWDMRKNGYSGFVLGNCVYALRVRGVAHFPSRLFRMVPVENLLGRKFQSFQSCSEMEISYLTGE